VVANDLLHEHRPQAGQFTDEAQDCHLRCGAGRKLGNHLIDRFGDGAASPRYGPIHFAAVKFARADGALC